MCVFELTSSTNLEKAKEPVKRPCIYTMDISCPAAFPLWEQARMDDETLRKGEVIQQEAHFQIRFETPDLRGKGLMSGGL